MAACKIRSYLSASQLVLPDRSTLVSSFREAISLRGKYPMIISSSSMTVTGADLTPRLSRYCWASGSLAMSWCSY